MFYASPGSLEASENSKFLSGVKTHNKCKNNQNSNIETIALPIKSKTSTTSIMYSSYVRIGSPRVKYIPYIPYQNVDGNRR